eukprot:TRINITY_DN1136_c0_g1_i2.p21 TRINITY_DN1136_c0_g1~~TRINITY_DN1136_c0_g1_i2.p21  ORF type:complete len:114 (+),score=20.99 TRINITY_DN1136_c0_g1_i2:417-758(+)
MAKISTRSQDKRERNGMSFPKAKKRQELIYPLKQKAWKKKESEEKGRYLKELEEYIKAKKVTRREQNEEEKVEGWVKKANGKKDDETEEVVSESDSDEDYVLYQLLSLIIGHI